jgi:hypothetical protein
MAENQKASAKTEIKQQQHKLMRLVSRRSGYLCNVALAGLTSLVFSAKSESVRLRACLTLLELEPVQERPQAIMAAGARRSVRRTILPELAAKLDEVVKEGGPEALRSVLARASVPELIPQKTH